MKLSMINDYEIVINYLLSRRWEKCGYLNYRTYANRIKYETKENNEYVIRKIFGILVKLNYIEKVKAKSKYLYKFNNPYFARFDKIIILYFD